MCKGPLTHSLHCSEFVELTLLYLLYDFPHQYWLLLRALHNHNGMKETHKKKFIDGFLNMRK